MTMERPFDVWYQRNPYPSFMAVLNGRIPAVKVECIKDTHIRVCRARAYDLESLWSWMQGENWSPNGEAIPLIDRLGLYHTSMSVGDVVYDVEDCSWWMVDAFGWKEVENGGQGKIGDTVN